VTRNYEGVDQYKAMRSEVGLSADTNDNSLRFNDRALKRMGERIERVEGYMG